MNKKFVIFSIGKLLEILAICMLIPLAIAIYESPVRSLPDIFSNSDVSGLLIAIISSLIFGNILKLLGSKELSGNGIREGFAIVTFGWLFLTLFGGVFYFANGYSDRRYGVQCFYRFLF